MQVMAGRTRAAGDSGTSIGFVDAIGARGQGVALIDRDGRRVSYPELDRLVGDAERRLGTGRRLVVIPMANHLAPVVWYLATLRAGHVALLTSSAGPALGRIVDRFDPDVVVDPERSSIERRRRATAHDLHPDLALLLSTSGSTGSSKLVRLSKRNLDANARVIAEVLDLRPSDRAITSLPLHYCYGLSVLHSHLEAGAGVVLTDTSVVDPCFWASVDAHAVTNIAGVPHTFDLLDRAGFDARHHTTLRLLTQAGGRLAPERVRRMAEEAAAQGIELRVMYGQTEATARIAVLDAHRALTDPHSVGSVVPGGHVRVEPVAGMDADIGELVYRGANVMMGYAERAEDLGRPAELDELRTGDLARITDDGLIEIVGRRADFLKLFGLRIDLREVGRIVADVAPTAEVGGDDGGLVIGVGPGIDTSRVRDHVVRHVHLPPASVAVAVVDPLPRLDNGKIDRPGLLAAVRSSADATAPTAGRTDHPVAALYAELLGTPAPAPSDTFVSLGGDSLSYVEASIRLEAELGHLPDNWHVTPIAELEATARRRERLGWSRQVETNVALRAVAILLVLANHTGAFLIGGGAHVLLGAAGFNLARFQLAGRSPWSSILRLAIPAVAWVGLVAATTDDFDLAHALMLHGWIGGRGRWAYWFVEVLLQLLVVVGALMSIPAVRRLERRVPFGFPAMLLVPALLVRFDVIDLGTHHRLFFRPHEVAWIFLLGWLAERSTDARQRAVVSALVLATVPGFFGDPTREAVLAGGILVLLWLRRIPVPRLVAPALGALASASLWIYLTHYQVHPLLSDRHPLAAMVLSVAVGVAGWSVVGPWVQAIVGRSIRRPAHGELGEHGAPIRDTVVP